MKRLLVCYNPRASHHDAVKSEVLSVVRGLKGWMVGRCEIKPTSFRENVQDIAKLVNDGDLVIVAGGDGSAAIVVNAILESGKDATLGVLGYGNFNDIARMLGIARMSDDEGNAKGGVAEILEKYQAGEIEQIYPLDVAIDGTHWRYAPSYMTVGMFAQSTEIFDQPVVRKKLQTGKKSRIFSIVQLAKWYFGHRRQSILPAGKLNGAALPAKTTDYIALNGVSMAGMMKGGEWYLAPQGFLSSTQRLSGFWRLAKFMLGSMREQVPGEVHEKDVLEFAEPSDIEIHAEGEYERLKEVSRIEVEKKGMKLKVVMGNRAE